MDADRKLAQDMINRGNRFTFDARNLRGMPRRSMRVKKLTMVWGDGAIEGRWDGPDVAAAVAEGLGMAALAALDAQMAGGTDGA